MQTPKAIVAMPMSLETYFVANKPGECAKNEFFYFFFIFYRSTERAAGICMDKTQINISN